MTAGVALIGAATIAVSPIAPPNVELPTIRASSVPVALSALADPVEKWAHVIEASLANVDATAKKWLADPAPIVRQIIANQTHAVANLPAITQALLARLGAMDSSDPDSVPDAFGRFVTDQLNGVRDLSDITATLLGDLAATLDPADPFAVPATLQRMLEEIGNGEFASAFTAFASLGVAVGFPVIMAGFPLSQVLSTPLNDLADIIDPTGVASQPLRNLARVIDVIPSVAPSVLLNGILGPVNAVGFAAAKTLEDVVAAVMTADPAALVSALAGAPADITDALLNGASGPDGFTAAGLFGGPFGVTAVGSVLDVLSSIANAITPAGGAGFSAKAGAGAQASQPADDVAAPPKSDANTGVVLNISPKVEVGATQSEGVKPAHLTPAVGRTKVANDRDAITAGAAAEPGETTTATTTSGSGAEPGGDNADQTVDKVVDESAISVSTPAAAGGSDDGGTDAAAGDAGDSAA
jgi:hypothetical protein